MGRSTGKRLRPTLCLLVAEQSGGDWRPSIPAAAAVELVHNFSLVHDDIQDASPLRRHQEAVWTVWGTAQGINVGDGLLILAEQALLDASPQLTADVVIEAARLLNQSCRALCEGQYLDLLWEEELAVTVEQYLEMIERKTARLFQCSAELGALCSGADATARTRWGQFGNALGMAFQAWDDLIGVWGPAAESGKTADLDVANRKKTLPIILGLSNRNAGDAARLREIFSVRRQLTPEETAEATSLLNRLGVREQATVIARKYRSEALRHLDHLEIRAQSQAVRELIDLVLPQV
jgi:geranylgeranyl diphosphate synthase type I